MGDLKWADHEPYAESCSNDHWSDKWTCPACYTDLMNKREGTTTCEGCGAKLRLTVEYFPSCLAELIEPGDAEELREPSDAATKEQS